MKNTSRAFYGIIGIATSTKLLMNMSRRLVYPFAPEFARGLNVELSSITSLIALNQATAILGPLGAGFADRYGFKLLMLSAVALLTIGTFAAGFLPIYTVLMISLFLTGMTKSLFDPSLQAYIGNCVPIQHRGKVIGITETAWAGSTLIGIPVAGVLIEKYSWQTPFWILGILSLICFFLLLKFMPSDHNPDPNKQKKRQSILANWKIITKERQVRGVLGYAFFMTLANDNLFVVYGAWLEQSYGLSLMAIGFGTVFIGLSEILGEAGTAMFSDRIGLKRAVIFGTALTAVAYMALPALDTGLNFALTSLFMIFFCFEFTYVTAMSLGTELVPELRASTMSAFYAVGGIGRVIGAFAGGLLWTTFGIQGVSLVSAISTVLALATLLVGFSVRKCQH